MTRGADRCPSQRQLECGYHADDARVRAHAISCTRCGRDWADIARLETLGAQWRDDGPQPQHLEELRIHLLLGATAEAPPPARARPSWRTAALGLAGVAALAAIAVWARMAGAPSAEPHASLHSAAIVPLAGARYVVRSGQPDEVVDLQDGTVDIDVAPLDHGERFRVTTMDADVEVRGTSFRVAAADRHLQTVQVRHGIVEVRATGRQPVTLRAGQVWRAELSTPAVEAREVSPAPVQPPAGLESASRPAPAERAKPVRRSSPPDAAAPAYDRARPAASPARQAFDEAWRALGAGDYDQAAAGFTRAGDLARGGALEQDADYWRSVALARAGRADASIRAMQAFVRLYPDSSRVDDVRAMLGWLLLERGDRAAAKAAFEAAVTGGSRRARESAQQGLDAIHERESGR